MKKIVSIMTVVIAFGTTAIAQNPNPARTLSAEEANRLNGVAQPTVNGKPYSQYVSEQNSTKELPAATNNIAAVRPALLKSLLSRPAENNFSAANTGNAVAVTSALPPAVKVEAGTASAIVAPKEEPVADPNPEEKKMSDVKKN